MATGRLPKTDLGLENTDVKCDSRGFIEVRDQLPTPVSGTWAIGDCNGKGAFTRTPYNHFEIVMENLLEHENYRVSGRISAYAVCTDPPLARIGITETEVRTTDRPVHFGHERNEASGAGKDKGETQGFMKILIDAKSKEISGCAILGTGGDEAIHCILDVMNANKPCATLQRAVHIHPTLSEPIPTMLGNLKPLC